MLQRELQSTWIIDGEFFCTASTFSQLIWPYLISLRYSYALPATINHNRVVYFVNKWYTHYMVLQCYHDLCDSDTAIGNLNWLLLFQQVGSVTLLFLSNGFLYERCFLSMVDTDGGRGWKQASKIIWKKAQKPIRL
jgi:hypothetical protein